MPRFSITDVPVDWDEAVYIKTFESANPVFCLSNEGLQKLYIKFMRPGEAYRSQFATELIRITKLTSYQSRIVDLHSEEGLKLFNVIYQLGQENAGVLNKIGDIKVGIDGSERNEIMIMGDLREGRNLKPFASVSKTLGDNIVLFFQNPRFIKDLGRMMAADFILGNFDRVAYIHEEFEREHVHEEWIRKCPLQLGAKFHGKNFFVDPGTGEIVPIDNEAILVAVENTKTDLLNRFGWVGTLIKGGPSAGSGSTFTDSSTPSLDSILSPTMGPVAIRRICERLFFTQIQASGVNLTQFYIDVAAAIRKNVRRIIDHLKDRMGAEGLNSRLKFMQNDPFGYAREGLDYNAFKIKMKYAALVTDPTAPLADDQALRQTEEYGKYRLWKTDLQRIPPFIFDTVLPAIVPQRPADMGFFAKGKRKIAAVAGSPFGFQFSRSIGEGHQGKLDIRSHRQDIEELRRFIQQFRAGDDRSEQKALFEAIFYLTKLNMLLHREMIGEILVLIHRIALDRSTIFYVKAMHKYLTRTLPSITSLIERYKSYYQIIKTKSGAHGAFDPMADLKRVKDDMLNKYAQLKDIYKNFMTVERITLMKR